MHIQIQLFVIETICKNESDFVWKLSHVDNFVTPFFFFYVIQCDMNRMIEKFVTFLVSVKVVCN